jgi:PKHD-type hydroxylase|tara:strand:- start:4330 stop:4902 length:573 start_codon:yes stop_codon:yes gene_type:complete
MIDYLLTHIDEDLIEELLSHKKDTLEDGLIQDSSGRVKRRSNITWLEHPIGGPVSGGKETLSQEVFRMVKDVNKDRWQSNIDTIEALQYSEYPVDGEYGWHQDILGKPYPDGRIRKVTFSILINDDYTGGEFDLEIHGPEHEEEGKRYITFSRQETDQNILFFESSMWHRVRPVKSGLRKSLVGWSLGPA